MLFPEVASQILTVLSSLAEAMCRPSGDQVTAHTIPAWPRQVKRLCPGTCEAVKGCCIDTDRLRATRCKGSLGLGVVLGMGESRRSEWDRPYTPVGEELSRSLAC